MTDDTTQSAARTENLVVDATGDEPEVVTESTDDTSGDHLDRTSTKGRWSGFNEGVKQGVSFLAIFGLLGAYAALLGGPVVLALWVTKEFVPMPSLLGGVIYVTLSVIFLSVAVVIGHWLNMLDFENATGRLGGR